MMTLDQKLGHAFTVIEKVLQKYKNPVVCLSFGKDSVLMLHIIRKWFNEDIECVNFRVPNWPRKHAWGNRLVEDWNLKVSYLPPTSACMLEKDGRTEVMWGIKMKQTFQHFLLGKLPIEGAAEWVCGKDQLLNHPRGQMEWNWDVAFHGHKASDTDNVLGSVPIDTDIYSMGLNECDLAYPLRLFTNEDVIDMSKRLGVPVNTARLEDKLFDPDFMPYCSDCLDRSKPSTVKCPQNGLMVQNISAEIPYLDLKTIKNLKQ